MEGNGIKNRPVGRKLTKDGGCARMGTGAARYGRRLALPGREVMRMVTYAELIQIGILIVSICNLVYQICKRK